MTLSSSISNSKSGDPNLLGSKPLPADAYRAMWVPLARRAAIWSTIAALLVLAICMAIAWTWRPDLPDRVISHWGVGGKPTSTMPTDASIIWFGPLGAVLGVLPMSLMCRYLGKYAGSRRSLAWTAVYLGGMFGAMLLCTLWIQRGLSDPWLVGRLPWWAHVVYLIAPTIPASVVAALLPGDPPMPTAFPPTHDAALSLPKLAAGERLAWTERLGSRIPLLQLAIITALLVVPWLVLAIYGQVWWPILVALSFMLLLIAFSDYRLRISSNSLVVKSRLGWPRIRIPANEVIAASVIDVNPMEDFGGYGWRIGAFGPARGRIGVLTRNGDALLVERTGSRDLVVTTKDPAKTAALINAMRNITKPQQ